MPPLTVQAQCLQYYNITNEFIIQKASTSTMKEKLLVILKNCLSSSGQILKAKSGEGVNLLGLSPDFKISDLNEKLQEQGFALVAIHFEEEEIAPKEKGGDWTIKEESVYVGPPKSGKADDLGNIFNLS